jgi:MinD superfamily P-loop ATPase
MDMMEIAITSAERGAGKTSIAASFAALAGNAVVVDCGNGPYSLYRVLAAAPPPGEDRGSEHRTTCGTLVIAPPAGGNGGAEISATVRNARELAEEKGFRCIIIDGPEGSLIGSIPRPQDTRATLIVIGPTVTGLRDLERIAGLAAGPGVKACACVNRFDADREMTHRIIDWCGERGIPMIGKVPFDLDFNRAQTAGTTMAEFSFGAASYEIAYMWGRISRGL